MFAATSTEHILEQNCVSDVNLDSAFVLYMAFLYVRINLTVVGYFPPNELRHLA